MPATCLIAEADPFIASLLLRFAEESGVNTVRAKTGQEILALAAEFRPEILVVEPELPGELRGWEAVRALRAEDKVKAEAENGVTTSTIAVISCSWLSKTEAHELLGAIAWHLQKPNLYYSDFVSALEASGFPVEEHPG